jgi:hypothetical protein
MINEIHSGSMSRAIEIMQSSPLLIYALSQKGILSQAMKPHLDSELAQMQHIQHVMSVEGMRKMAEKAAEDARKEAEKGAQREAYNAYQAELARRRQEEKERRRRGVAERREAERTRKRFASDEAAAQAEFARRAPPTKQFRDYSAQRVRHDDLARIVHDQHKRHARGYYRDHPPERHYMNLRKDKQEMLHVLASHASYGNPVALRNFDSVQEIAPGLFAFHKGKNIILAARGTKYTRDVLVTDLEGIFGFRDYQRFDVALDAAQQYMRLHPESSFSVAGHSLGGSIADYLASELQLDGHVYNPFRRFSDKPQRVSVHHIHGDPVGYMFTGKRRTYGKRGMAELLTKIPLGAAGLTSGLLAHKLDQFGTAEELEKRLSS